MSKNRYKNKSIKGGTLVPFYKEGNTTYFKVFANDPLKTDSVLVGPNNKNGIALDNNEIVKETGTNIEVASDDLGTVRVIESLSNKMPLPDAFRQGFIRQELYKDVKNIKNKNNNKFENGTDEDKKTVLPVARVVRNKNYDSTRPQKYYDYLRSNGLNHAQAIGILGNIAVESYLEPDMKQIDGPAYGLMQWEGKRQDRVRKYNKSYNFGSKLTPKEQNQLDYIIETTMGKFDSNEWVGHGFEGNNRSRDSQKAFKNTKDVDEATKLILNNYARPNDRKEDERLTMSKYYDSSIINKYKLMDNLNKINDMILKSNKFSSQPSFSTGGRIRMNVGGDEDIKSDIEAAIITAEKPNTHDKIYVRKRKIGNKIYYDVDGKLIDNEQNAYRYATNLMNARGAIDMSDILNPSVIESTRKVMPFDSTTFTIQNNDKLQDNRKSNSNKNSKRVLINKNGKFEIYYPNNETSSYEDRPKETNVRKYYPTSSYEDRPIDVADSDFIGPILKNKIKEDKDIKEDKGIKEDKSGAGIKTNNNRRYKLITTPEFPDIAPTAEIENLSNVDTYAQRVADTYLNGQEFLPSINNSLLIRNANVLNQSPVKKGVYAIGKSGPSFIDKVKIGWNKFKNSIKTPEGMLAASAATDVVGNVISNAITQKAIDSTEYVSAPTQNQAYKLQTNYNINPQLNSLANAAANTRRVIDENTLSSKTRQNRLNLLGLNSALNANQLYANKENAETQLINQDIKNQQDVTNSNIDTYNKWLAAKTEFDNNKILNKAQSTSNMISGIGQAVGNLATGLTQANQFTNNMDLLKTLSPDAARLVFGARCGGKFNKRRK